MMQQHLCSTHHINTGQCTQWRFFFVSSFSHPPPLSTSLFVLVCCSFIGWAFAVDTFAYSCGLSCLCSPSLGPWIKHTSMHNDRRRLESCVMRQGTFWSLPSFSFDMRLCARSGAESATEDIRIGTRTEGNGASPCCACPSLSLSLCLDTHTQICTQPLRPLCCQQESHPLFQYSHT